METYIKDGAGSHACGRNDVWDAHGGTGEESSSVAALDAVEAVNVSDTGYDVVFCIDNSRSMWKQQDIRDQAVRVLANLAVGSDIRIGGVYFADHVYQRCSLTSLTGEEDTKKVMSFLNFTDKDDGNRDTNIGSALSEALKLFENQDISRKRIIVLFSDGINEDYEGTGSYTARANNMTSQAAGKSMRRRLRCTVCSWKRTGQTKPI